MLQNVSCIVYVGAKSILQKLILLQQKGGAATPCILCKTAEMTLPLFIPLGIHSLGNKDEVNKRAQCSLFPMDVQVCHLLQRGQEIGASFRTFRFCCRVHDS